jgi:AcrR family transcriptional regulator
VVGRRRYHSPIRDEYTSLSRRKILDAARTRFLDSGYLGTRLDQIAATAGVSVQTVYNVVGSKAKILKAVYDVALAGDDEPAPIGERPTFEAMLAETDPRRCLARYAELGRELGERALPLVLMVLAQAATGDPDLRTFAETIERERATGTREVATHMAGRFGLREGLDVEAAADILWTLTAPDVADRLVNRRGWGWDAFSVWLGETLADALLGPPSRARRAAATVRSSVRTR